MDIKKPLGKEIDVMKDFKEFILRGNVIDLAVAVIIGGAFGKIVSSFVNDIIMPPIGLLLANVDFSNLFINLSRTHHVSLAEARAAGAVTINYGIFMNAVVDFLIVALVMFLLVRTVNRMKRLHAAPPAPTMKDCPYCLSSIPLKAVRCGHCTSDLKSQ